MTRAKDISKILTDADLSGTLDVTGDLSVDNATLKVDSTNNRVGISTSSMTSKFEVAVSDNTSIQEAITIKGTQGGAYGGYLGWKDNWSGDSYTGYRGAIIADVPSANTGRLRFFTANSSTLSEKMRINANGQLLLGTTTSRGKFTIGVDSSSADGLYLDNANGGATMDLALLGSGYNAHGANAGEIWFYSPDNINIGGATGNTNSIKFLGGGAERMRIDANGHVTMPYQSAFMATATATSNLAVNSTLQIGFASERFDQNADYNTTNSTFTAPVTGKYQLQIGLRLDSVDSAAVNYQIRINTTNKLYVTIFDSNEYTSDLSYVFIAFSVLADMDAGDTAIVNYFQNSGTQQTDVDADSYFSGFLAC